MTELNDLEKVVLNYLKKTKRTEVTLTEIKDKKLQNVHISNIRKMLRFSHKLRIGYIPDGIGWQATAVLK